MRHALHKTRGGLIRVSVDAGDRINDIRITGDFFIYPEESIEALETALVGTSTDEGNLLKVVKDFYEDIEAMDLDPEDIVEAIKKALYVQTSKICPTNFQAFKIERAKELMQLEGDELEKLFDAARTVKENLTGKRVNFYFTGNSFPAISVTGDACALDCKHCGRNMLKGVYSAKKGDEIVSMAKTFEKRGAIGCLFTGGCRPDGSVPIDEFLDVIETLKRETSLFLLAHTGIIDMSAAKALKDAGLDGVSLDIVGNAETAKKVYGIEIGPEKYRESLIALEKHFAVVSPHICVGLDFGKVSHELEALEILSSIRPTTIEIIALMPLRGTPMENSRPDPMDVAKVIAIAQLCFPETPIILGCAHSKGTDRAIIEELALRAGASSIALPTPKTEALALKMGYETMKIGTCCAVGHSRSAHTTCNEAPAPRMPRIHHEKEVI